MSDYNVNVVVTVRDDLDNEASSSSYIKQLASAAMLSHILAGVGGQDERLRVSVQLPKPEAGNEREERAYVKAAALNPILEVGADLDLAITLAELSLGRG